MTTKSSVDTPYICYNHESHSISLQRNISGTTTFGIEYTEQQNAINEDYYQYPVIAIGKWFSIFLVKGDQDKFEISTYSEKNLADVTQNDRLPLLLTYYLD